MIKKMLALLSIFSLTLTLCGCNSLSVFSSDSHKYLISALGFEEENNIISIYAEALVINSEDMTADKKRIVFKGSGNSCEIALNSAKLSATENFDLSHCGVIALSSNLSPENLKDILNWCYNTDQITLSAYIVSCESPYKILKSEPVSSVATGYDILSLLEKTNEISGIEFENSLFRVIGKSESEVNVFSLPFISLENERRAITGLSIIKDHSHITTLDNSKTFLYSLITDSFSGGNVTLEDKTYHIKSEKTTYKIDKENNFIINIPLKISAEAKKNIKNNLEDFIFWTKNDCGDIFGIGNIIEHQNSNLWKKIKKDFNNIYITVAVK